MGEKPYKVVLTFDGNHDVVAIEDEAGNALPVVDEAVGAPATPKGTTTDTKAFKAKSVCLQWRTVIINGVPVAICVKWA